MAISPQRILSLQAAAARSNRCRTHTPEFALALDAATPDGPTRDSSGYDRVVARYVDERRVWRSVTVNVGVFQVVLRWHRKLKAVRAPEPEPYVFKVYPEAVDA